MASLVAKEFILVCKNGRSSSKDRENPHHMSRCSQEGATSWRGTSAVHQLVAFPRVSRLVLAKVGGGGGGTGAQVVGVSGGQPGPLGGGTSVRAELRAGVCPVLRPASGRVFKGLLPTVHGHVQQPVTGAHHLRAAPAVPVGFEHAVAVPQVAHQHAKAAPGDQGGGCVLC